MHFTIEDRTYSIQIASDIIRNGLGAELWDFHKNIMLIEIFRNDSKKKIEFFAENVDIPLRAVELLIKEFEKSVGRDFQE